MWHALPPRPALCQLPTGRDMQPNMHVERQAQVTLLREATVQLTSLEAQRRKHVRLLTRTNGAEWARLQKAIRAVESLAGRRTESIVAHSQGQVQEDRSYSRNSTSDDNVVTEAVNTLGEDIKQRSDGS
jgi:hypothetical protein